jgi:GT2 family glycosyltransferase
MYGSELPEIAIMILNYNGLQFIDNCLSSLFADLYPNKKIYFLDNCSTDKSIEFVESKYSNATIVKFKNNNGFSYSYDHAIRSVENKYIAILNNDTCVHPMWLNELYNAMKENESIGACGSKILNYHSRNLIDHAGGLINAIGGGVDIGKGKIDSSIYNQKKYVGFSCGGAALLNRNAYISVGGFDRKFFLYHEDVDLCWRLWISGYQVLYVPTAIVFHHGGGTSGNVESPFRIYHSQKSRIRCLLKNAEMKYLTKGILTTIIFDLIRSFMYLFKVDFKCFAALWRANISTLSQMNDFSPNVTSLIKRKSLNDIEKKYRCKITSPIIDSFRAYWKI